MAGDASVEVQPSPSARAEQNGPDLVQVWLGGVPALVPADRVAEMQARGALMYGPEDLERLSGEIDHLLEGLSGSARRFVDGILADRQIDPAEGAEAHVMQQALRTVTARIQDLVNVAYQSFPVASTEELDDERLDRLAVDAQYHGWGETELATRYGLDTPTAQAVLGRKVRRPSAGPLRALVEGSDTWTPLQDVPDSAKERIVSISTVDEEG